MIISKPGLTDEVGRNVKRRIIQYNPLLKDRAKKLRQNMTFSEVILWNKLKNGQIMGYDFDRQRPIGNYIVDFYCKDLQLALEVDGKSHEDERTILKDKKRQKELEMLSVSFLRFNALLVVNKVESVIKEIEKWIVSYEEKNGVSMIVSRKRSKMNPPQILKETSDSISPLQGGEGALTEKGLGFEKAQELFNIGLKVQHAINSHPGETSPPGRGELSKP